MKPKPIPAPTASIRCWAMPVGAWWQARGFPRDDLPRPHHRRRAGESAFGRLRAEFSRPQAGGDRSQARRARPHRRRGPSQGLCEAPANALRLFDQWHWLVRHRHAQRQGRRPRAAVPFAARLVESLLSARQRLARPLRRGAVRNQWRQVAAALLPAQRHQRGAGSDRAGQGRASPVTNGKCARSSSTCSMRTGDKASTN